MRIARFLLPALGIACLFSSLSSAATPDRISGTLTSGPLVTLTGQVHVKARPEFDQGPVEPSYRLDYVTMFLQPSASQQEALQELLTEQQDPASPNYHHWLTSTQFGERFGLSQKDVQTIVAWLKSQGFKIVSVANGRQFIVFGGTAAQIANTFQTQIHRYNVNGEMHIANATAPKIPAALSGIVTGFRGLHDFNPRPLGRKAPPSPDYTDTINGAGTFHFIAPGDVYTIYDINTLANTGINGTGQSIVIVGQSDIYVDDIQNFRSGFGLPAISGCSAPPSCNTTYFQYIQANGSVGYNAGNLSESDLDIEWSGAMAPSAKVIFVTSTLASGGVGFSAQTAIDSHPLLAPIISYSYGACELFSTPPSLATQDMLYQQAASEGISFFAAAGDVGPAACDANPSNPPTEGTQGLSVSYPASSQWVTALGGTEFNDEVGSYWASTNTNQSSATGPIPEIVWNDTTQSLALDATGGGPSNCGIQNATFTACVSGFPKPSWQTGTGVPTDGVRDIPDISFSAANLHDPYIVCTPLSELGLSGSTSSCNPGGTQGIANALDIQSGGFIYFSAFGGTSVPTPVMAGVTALLNQKLGGTGLGLINKKLYELAASNPSAFNDVTSGNNDVPCATGSPNCPAPPATQQYGFSAGTGYDLVTGWGSLDVNAFATAWADSLAGFSLTPSPASLSAVAGQNSNSTTITITPQNGFTGTVSFSSTSCSGLPSGASCSFNPATVSGGSGTTQMTIQTHANVAVGTTTVTVTGTASGISESATVNLDVTATTESFTLTPSVPSGGTVTVAQGQTTAAINFTISSSSTPSFVTSSGGAPATVVPVTYSCSTNLPSESHCKWSPGDNGNGTATTQATAVSLTIQTTAPTAELRRPFDRGTRIFYAVLLPGLLGIAFTFGSRKRGLGGMRLLGLIMVLGCSTLWLGSCGGSSGSSTSNPGTPVGMTRITVTAGAGGSVPNQSTTFVLNVTAVAK